MLRFWPASSQERTKARPTSPTKIARPTSPSWNHTSRYALSPEYGTRSIAVNAWNGEISARQ
jgi:hypothetical protein